MSRHFKLICIVLALLLLPLACKQVDMVAPTGSTLSMTASPLAVATSGRSTLTVTGTRPGSGAPLPDGTVIRFTVTDKTGTTTSALHASSSTGNIGTVSPNPVETRDGVATAYFYAGQQSGTALITANSGGATGGPGGTGGTNTAAGVQIVIGQARATTVILTANPASLPPFGGSTVLTAWVTDANGNSLQGIDVRFSTDNGTLRSGGHVIKTKANGVANDVLTTTLDANVTATTANNVKSETLLIKVGPGTGAQCAFNFSPASPVAPNQRVTFVDASTSTGNVRIINSLWNFGDGATATGLSATHSYPNTGTYTVVHTITDSLGFTTNCTQTIEVAVTGGPQCSYEFSPQSPVANQTVNFTSTSIPGTSGAPIVSWHWTFGDGSSASGERVRHAYRLAGSYSVVLTVTDSLGLTSNCFESVNVTTAEPTCSFEYSPLDPVKKQNINFIDTSTPSDITGAPIVVSLWNFGNGAMLSGLTVQYAYPVDGTYLVIHTVTDSLGQSSTCAAVEITVSP